MSKQTTISASISLSGKGLHTGKQVTVTFLPAPAGHGIVFRRVDLPGTPTVKALGTNVFDTSRGTSIREGEAEVRTIEHLMAVNIVEQDAEREYFIVKEPVTFTHPEKQISITVTPADDFQAEVEVDYGTQVLASQHAEIKDIKKFVPELYNCRMFVFLHELLFLIQHRPPVAVLPWRRCGQRHRLCGAGAPAGGAGPAGRLLPQV